MLAIAAGTVVAGAAANASVTPLPNLTLVTPAPTQTTGTPALTSTAQVDDPGLSGYCTYDVQVVVSSASGPDHWASGDLRAQLGGGGKFYIPPGAPFEFDSDGNPGVFQAVDQNFYQPSGNRAAPKRYLNADTMIVLPVSTAGSNGNILGKSAYAPASETGVTFPSNGSNFLTAFNTTDNTTFRAANSMDLVDVAWGDTGAASNNATNGTYTIARLTVKVGSQGTFLGRVGSTLNPTQPVSFTYILGGGVIPEPTSVALLGLGLGAVALRRRK
jgi:hypothetical protein